jgi:hypothetical protein
MTMTDLTASRRLPATSADSRSTAGTSAGSGSGRRSFLRATGSAALMAGTAALLSGC